MNIFPLWCDRQARIKASFIQIRTVHTRPGRPLGFDINDVWNRALATYGGQLFLQWLGCQLNYFFWSTMSAGSFCVRIRGMRHHLYTNRPHKPVCPSKTCKKLQWILVYWYCKVTLSVCSLVKGKQIWDGIVHHPLLVCQCKFTMTI